MRHDFETGYLEHSAKGSTWKKGTKYIKKIKKNGKWVYVYSIDDERFTGKEKTPIKGRPGEYLINEKTAAGKQFLSKEATKSYHKMKAKEKTVRGAAAVSDSSGRWLSDKEKNREANRYAAYANEFAREAQRYGEAATRQKIEAKKKAESNPINKAVLMTSTIVDKAADAGKKLINNILAALTPQTTVRITSNLMPANTEKVYKKKK